MAYTVISLFSGAMGFDIGIESTKKFNLLACVEKVPVFCNTIRANIKNGNLPKKLRVYETDIRLLDPKQLLEDLKIKPGELDLLIGGPPCQAFSTAGKRGTLDDPRGTLLWDYLRFIKALQPKIFLMENVRGLISAAIKHRPIMDRPDKGGKSLSKSEKPGSVISMFADDLKNIDDFSYKMDVFEVNSVNYGAPQIRERVVFVGNRYNLKIDFPEPTHFSPSNDSAQSSLFEIKEKKYWRTLRDAIGDLKETNPVIMDFSPRKIKYLSLVPEGSNWRSLPVEIQKESMGKAWLAKGGRSGWWRRLTFDLPSPTLVTMPNHASTSLCHPKETRVLSVREYARIQEFPDTWEITGKPLEQYTQIGNAVPTRLGRVAGELAFETLNIIYRKKLKPQKTCDPFRIVYVQSHIRTRKWFFEGEAVLWNENGSDNPNYSSPKTRRREKVLG